MSDTNRVLWRVWWKDPRHSEVDLIRGILNVFKNESHFAATPTTVFTTPLNGQLAGRGLVRLLNTPSNIWMGGLITLSLMIHWLAHAFVNTSGDNPSLSSVFTAASSSSNSCSFNPYHNISQRKHYFILQTHTQTLHLLELVLTSC